MHRNIGKRDKKNVEAACHETYKYINEAEAITEKSARVAEDPELLQMFFLLLLQVFKGKEASILVPVHPEAEYVETVAVEPEHEILTDWLPEAVQPKGVLCLLTSVVQLVSLYTILVNCPATQVNKTNATAIE
jgi:hypothetical protein